MPIAYTPTFAHTDWVDNVDRVQAGGDTGFNGRFHGIEGEFATLTAVVKQISDAIDGLSAAPQVKTLATALTPTLVPTTTVAAQQWQHVDGAAVIPPGQTTAHGMMGVQLPNGANVKSMRMVGYRGSGTLLVGLQRQLFADGSAPEVIVAGQLGGAQSGPFDLSSNATDATKTKVDNTQYRYYVVARLDGGNAAALQGAALDAIVVIHDD